MEHVRWLADDTELGHLRQPVLLAAFTGWNDAADAASMAVRTLIETTDARPLAEIDPEAFTDFATIRPHVRLDADRRRSIVWPTVGIWSASLPGTDVILMLGPEPALRWRTFAETVIGMARRLDCRLAITLGALLADVPHTRPTPLIGTATDQELIDRFDLEASRYEGPTGIVGVLQANFADAGIPSASIWGAVPGYASQVPSPKAALALLIRTCSMLGTPTPRSGLDIEAANYDTQVANLIVDDDDLRLYVARLESLLDEEDDESDDDLEIEIIDTGRHPSLPLDDDPDVLVSEVEQFLRDHDGDR